jgi:hypothetical protein
MIAVVVLFVGPSVALGDRLFSTNDILRSDLWHFHIPWKAFMSRELAQGHLPFWCPGAGSGFPLLGEGQAGVLYPLHIVLFGLLPLPVALNWTVILHLALAGFFSFAWMRERGASLAAAFLAGVVFALSGSLVTHIKHMNMLEAACWMPFLLWMIDRSLRTGGGKTSLVGLAVGSAMVVLAGHPQMAYYNLLLAGAYALARSFGSTGILGAGGGLGVAGGLEAAGRLEAAGGRGRLLPALRSFVWIATALILGVALGAPQLLTTLEYSRETSRASGLTFAESTEVDSHPSYLGLFLDPSARGEAGRLDAGPEVGGADGAEGGAVPAAKVSSGFRRALGNTSFDWEVNGYVGILALLLALMALLPGRGRPQVLPIAGIGLACLLLTLGEHGGLAWLFHHAVPGFSYFRGHGRFLVHVDLCLAALAAFGLDRVLRRMAGVSLRLVPVAAALAVLVCMAELFGNLAGYNGTVESDRWLRPPPTAGWIADQKDQTDPVRIWSYDNDRLVFQNAYRRAGGWTGSQAPYDPAMAMIQENLAVLYGLESADIYSPAVSRRMVLALESLKRDPVAQKGVASLLNIRYVISADSQLGRSYQPAISFPGDVVGLPIAVRGQEYRLRIFRNDATLPRAFLVPRARLVPAFSAISDRGKGPESPDSIAQVLAPRFDPRTEVLVEALPGDQPFPQSSGQDVASGSVVLTRPDPDNLRLIVNASLPSWLYVGELWTPGWTASVDGERTRLWPANLVGRAVQVPAGNHEILMEYRPPGLSTGIAVAACSLAICVAILLGECIQRRRRRPTGSAEGSVPPALLQVQPGHREVLRVLGDQPAPSLEYGRRQ